MQTHYPKPETHPYDQVTDPRRYRRFVVQTDDFNPIDVADNWLKEQVRAEILRATDWSVLLR